MAGIGLYLPWDSQPQEVVGVNPDAGRITAAFNLVHQVDLVSGRPLIPWQSPTPTVGQSGRGLQFNGADNYVYRDMPEVGVYTAGATIFALVEGASVGTDRRAFGISSSVNNSNFFFIGSGASDQTKLRTIIVLQPGFGSSADSTAAVFDGKPHVACLRWEYGVGTTAFIDGVKDVFAANTGTAGITAMGRVSFGALLRINASNYFPGKVFGGVVVPRAMSDAEASAYSANLWQLFAPRSIWVPVSAGGAATHDTTGALTGAGSTVAGSAAHIAIHGTSGALAGPGSSIAGASARTRAHPTSGALTGPGSAIAGTAAHVVPGGTHDTTGALTGPGASIAGTAAHIAKHSTSGALAGQGAAVSGTAARVAAAVTHDTSGVLTGPGAVISGQARGPDIVIADTHDGFWSREWYRLKKREEKKPTIAEVVEIVKESPQVLEVVRTEVQRKYPRVDYAAVRENVTLQRFIAKQLIEAAEEEDDIEAMLLMA